MTCVLCATLGMSVVHESKRGGCCCCYKRVALNAGWGVVTVHFVGSEVGEVGLYVGDVAPVEHTFCCGGLGGQWEAGRYALPYTRGICQTTGDWTVLGDEWSHW